MGIIGHSEQVGAFDRLDDRPTTKHTYRGFKGQRVDHLGTRGQVTEYTGSPELNIEQLKDWYFWFVQDRRHRGIPPEGLPV